MREIISDGIWTRFQTPRAVWANGSLFIGHYATGGIWISKVDSSGRLTGAFLLLATGRDSHNVASIGIRADGRLIAAYSSHGDSAMRVRISGSPYDISSWGAEKQLTSGFLITYPQIFHLSSEDRWYLFFRAAVTPPGRPAYITSDDDGETWTDASPVFLTTDNGERPYAQIDSDGVDRIDISLTDGHPREVPDNSNSVYHLYYQAGGWFTSDGSSLGSPPFDHANLTQVWDGDVQTAWTWDMLTAGANPRMLFDTFDGPGADNHQYRHARWDGTQWNVSFVSDSGGGIPVGDPEAIGSGGIIFDRGNPDHVGLSRQVPGGSFEIERMSTSDGGQTWGNRQAVTSGTASPVRNFRPTSARGDGAAFRLMWIRGTHSGFTSFDTGIYADFAIAPVTLADVTELISGSHRATFSARVLTTFQTGEDPDGTEIEILGGSVTYDSTAKVFASLDLETSGMDERRRSRFPRTARDLLAPYGHEVFVRRGVDAGPNIVWVPLGYFRLDDSEQAPASDGPIRLSGQDRMSGIIDGELVTPRQYQPVQSVANVVASLVHDIYPAATIEFDDSGDADLGRQILVEKDRYGALHDIANSMGKVIYWDGRGVLRIEDAPEPDDIVWDIKAGRHGVLVDAQRRVSRENMVNAIVARGEGGDATTPVQAIAVDAGPQSPTSWFPPDDPDELWFGQVPGYYSSPLLTTTSGAFSAASKQLRRRIGMPYSVDFGSVVNPSLRPREAVRITHKGGTRERHLVETVTVPLRADRAMSGTTREQTHIRIANVTPAALSS